MGDTYDVIMAAYPAVEAAQKDFDEGAEPVAACGEVLDDGQG